MAHVRYIFETHQKVFLYQDRGRFVLKTSHALQNLYGFLSSQSMPLRKAKPDKNLADEDRINVKLVKYRGPDGHCDRMLSKRALNARQR